MEEYYVYLHKIPNTDIVFYVGKGKGSRAYDLKKRSVLHKRYVSKHGCDVEIVLDKISESRAFLQEILGIKHYKPICNFTIGGGGVSGYKRSTKEKNEISKRMKGSLNHRYGKAGTMLDKKQKDSALNKLRFKVYSVRKGKTLEQIYGKKKSENIIVKLSGKTPWNKDKKWDLGFKEKLSLAHGGKLIQVFNKQDNQLVDSMINMSECARKYNVRQSVLQRYLAKTRNQFSKRNKIGFYFKYKD